MATQIKIKMNRYNGTDYDQLLPETTIEQVVGLQTALDAKANTSAIPTATSQLTNDSGFITSAPVSSVNGKTGAVTLSASDVGAQAADTAINTGNIGSQSVNYATSAGSANSASSATSATNATNATYATYAKSSSNTGQVLRNQGLSSTDKTPSANGEIIWTYS